MKRLAELGAALLIGGALVRLAAAHALYRIVEHQAPGVEAT